MTEKKISIYIKPHPFTSKLTPNLKVYLTISHRDCTRKMCMRINKCVCIMFNGAPKSHTQSICRAHHVTDLWIANSDGAVILTLSIVFLSIFDLFLERCGCEMCIKEFFDNKERFFFFYLYNISWYFFYYIMLL